MVVVPGGCFRQQKMPTPMRATTEIAVRIQVEISIIRAEFYMWYVSKSISTITHYHGPTRACDVRC